MFDVQSLVPVPAVSHSSDLEKEGFVNRGGKGSHRNFVHAASGTNVTLSDSNIERRREEKELTFQTLHFDVGRSMFDVGSSFPARSRLFSWGAHAAL
jgi:predicted RNA binding protein YcfA (HicA-like mRNA interferase family)